MRDIMTRKSSGRRTTATPRSRAHFPSEATTSEKRENELIALAFELAEEALLTYHYSPHESDHTGRHPLRGRESFRPGAFNLLLPFYA